MSNTEQSHSGSGDNVAGNKNVTNVFQSSLSPVTKFLLFVALLGVATAVIFLLNKNSDNLDELVSKSTVDFENLDPIIASISECNKADDKNIIIVDKEVNPSFFIECGGTIEFHRYKNQAWEKVFSQQIEGEYTNGIKRRENFITGLELKPMFGRYMGIVRWNYFAFDILNQELHTVKVDMDSATFSSTNESKTIEDILVLIKQDFQDIGEYQSLLATHDIFSLTAKARKLENQLEFIPPDFLDMIMTNLPNESRDSIVEIFWEDFNNNGKNDFLIGLSIDHPIYYAKNYILFDLHPLTINMDVMKFPNSGSLPGDYFEGYSINKNYFDMPIIVDATSSGSIGFLTGGLYQIKERRTGNSYDGTIEREAVYLDVHDSKLYHDVLTDLYPGRPM